MTHERQQYAGRLRGRLIHRGLELAETSYRAGQRVDRHVHDRPMMVLVLAGAMTEQVRGRTVHCPAGTALYHPAGEAHAHRFGAPGTRCLVAQLSESWLDRLEVEADLVPEGPVTRLGASVTGAARLLHREFRRADRAVTAALDGLTLTLLASLARPETPPPDRRPHFLDRVIERLNDDPATDVDLASLAALAGVTPEHLARTFREQLGCTVGEYVRRLRVERARRELARGDLPLSQLAIELGFYDQSHFTRVFKAHVGCPPGVYRRRTKLGLQ